MLVMIGQPPDSMDPERVRGLQKVMAIWADPEVDLEDKVQPFLWVMDRNTEATWAFLCQKHQYPKWSR